MKNVLKYIFNWQMCLVFIINLLLADTACFTWNILKFAPIHFIFGDDELKSVSIIFVYLSIIIMLVRLFVLPIFYYCLEKFTKDKLVQNFLYGLRHSKKMKLIILLISPIPFIIENIIISPTIKIQSFFYPLTCVLYYQYSLFAGLLGSYVVLFLYWYILDKKKKAKNPELIEGQKNE